MDAVVVDALRRTVPVGASFCVAGSVSFTTCAQTCSRSDADPIVVNSTRTTGNVATPSDNGFLLSGRWDIVSGVDAADWALLFAQVSPLLAGRMR
jgi:hypothetical protein